MGRDQYRLAGAIFQGKAYYVVFFGSDLCVHLVLNQHNVAELHCNNMTKRGLVLM